MGLGDANNPDPPKSNHDPDGIRTRVAALKGPCPRPLDDGAAADGGPSALGGGRQYADGRRAVNEQDEERGYEARSRGLRSGLSCAPLVPHGAEELF